MNPLHFCDYAGREWECMHQVPLADGDHNCDRSMVVLPSAPPWPAGLDERAIGILITVARKGLFEGRSSRRSRSLKEFPCAKYGVMKPLRRLRRDNPQHSQRYEALLRVEWLHETARIDHTMAERCAEDCAAIRHRPPTGCRGTARPGVLPGRLWPKSVRPAPERESHDHRRRTQLRLPGVPEGSSVGRARRRQSHVAQPGRIAHSSRF
jgi:hypothetical protein